MLPKIAHYAGFQSYGDLAYPNLKSGKKELQSDTIYQETVRKGDELKYYKNTDRWTTLYDQDISKAVVPEDYKDPLRVTKQQVEKPLLSANGNFSPSKSTLPPQQRTFANESSFQPHQKGVDLYNSTIAVLKKETQDEPKQGNLHTSTQSRYATAEPGLRTQKDALDNFEYLANGTEHWKSTYVASIVDPYAGTQATRPDWSLNKPAYTVPGEPRTSNYVENFGVRGTNPLEKLSTMTRMPPVPKSDDPLALGTTKATYHIPGYTGHMPKSLAVPTVWDQAVGSNPRETYLKQNITENYQTRIPGYAGHRPTEAVNDRGQLRQSCFSTAGEKFY